MPFGRSGCSGKNTAPPGKTRPAVIASLVLLRGAWAFCSWSDVGRDDHELPDNPVINQPERLEHGALSLDSVPQSDRRAATEPVWMRPGEPADRFGLTAERLYCPSEQSCGDRHHSSDFGHFRCARVSHRRRSL